MNAITVSTRQLDSLESLQRRFLALLPRIEQHGRIVFRHLQCAHQREEALAEMTALAWKWFVRLASKGKDAADFITVLATYAARAVKSGRQVCGQQRVSDVLSATAQQRHGFTVTSLYNQHSLHSAVFADALEDNMLGDVFYDYAEEARRKNDAVAQEQAQSVASALFVVGLGIDAACPRS